jgi:hypothetical protein
MVEGNFTLTPDMIWDGKARERQTPEEITAWLEWHKDFHQRMIQAEKDDPLPDDFIEYCKGRK